MANTTISDYKSLKEVPSGMYATIYLKEDSIIVDYIKNNDVDLKLLEGHKQDYPYSNIKRISFKQ